MKPTIPKKQDFKKVVETSTKKELATFCVCILTDYKMCQEDGLKYLKPNEVHYLIPVEWYNIIPVGYPVVDIFGKKKKFTKKLSKESRYGCLSYGFIRNFHKK